MLIIRIVDPLQMPEDLYLSNEDSCLLAQRTFDRFVSGEDINIKVHSDYFLKEINIMIMYSICSPEVDTSKIRCIDVDGSNLEVDLELGIGVPSMDRLIYRQHALCEDVLWRGEGAASIRKIEDVEKEIGFSWGQ